MKIFSFCCGPFQTNTYLIACEQTNNGAVVDPALGSKELCMETLEKAKIRCQAIFLTHSHFDHIAEVSPLKKEYGAAVYIHPFDAPNLENPGSDLLPLPFPIEGVMPDYFLEDGMRIMLGNMELLVIHTPGHTPGGVCFYAQKEKILFSGDTLFQGSIGNISFPTAQPQKMWDSLKKLSRLPSETKVYPGHGPPTTMKKENWLEKAEEIFSG
ncbi:MAG: MBL fold metallo-hydrolase [Simkaniaceae bacterium]